MSEKSSILSELPHLLQLLDDEEPVVKKSVAERLQSWGGDVSREVAVLGIDISPKDRARLAAYLRPARRKKLRELWLVPDLGFASSDGDWEAFEASLRLVSDYLHDGVVPRGNLTDGLDKLAESAELEVRSASELADFLFKSKRFIPNMSHYYAPENSDLSWVMETCVSNPLGLCLIYILVGQRLGLPVYGCNYPGHFLAWIEESGSSLVVDCYHHGQVLSVSEVRGGGGGSLSPDANDALNGPCSLAAILRRLLNNLKESFIMLNELEDAELMNELGETLSEKG